MNDVFTQTTVGNDSLKSSSINDTGTYVLKSEKLKYVAPFIYYSRKPDDPIKLDQYYIPVDSTSPKLKRLSDEDTYVDTALALCDGVIRRSRNGLPPKKALQKVVANYWNTMLFLRSKGVYSLKNASRDDITDLCKEFSKGGWASALEVERKVSLIIEEFTAENIGDSIIIYGKAPKLRRMIDGLKSRFWRSRIGLKSATLLNSRTKQAFEEKAKLFGYSFTERWNSRFELEPTVPTENSYRNLLSFLNNLYNLPQHLDKLTFLPFDQVAYWSNKYALRTAGRTENLDVEAAAHILGKALDWIYDYGERLVSTLEHCWRVFPDVPSKDRAHFLENSNLFEELAKDLGITTPNAWNLGRHPYSKPKICQPVDELIGATQGACAVAIAGFNARRSSEVCDDEIGLREIDFLLDEEFDVHKVNFYIEKSYQDRHWFYVNKATSDAIKLLIRLKNASRPFHAEHSQNGSLFRANNWTKKGPSDKSTIFAFSRSKDQVKSMASFLRFLDDEYVDIDLKSHMWRRFFSLIYIYRYDHSTLQSLSQHLRHLTIHRTTVYVTDPSARSETERISEKVQNIKQNRIMDLQLLNSLYRDNEELNNAIQAVKNEKFSETIHSIIGTNRHSGGFPRLVRKLYKSFSKNMNFSALDETEKGRAISTALISRGYTSDPMLHGQCNAPANDQSSIGRCSIDGRLKKERASPAFCQNCMFHSKSDQFIKNLVYEISVLDEDIASKSIPNHIRSEAIEARNSLMAVIDIHNHSANINSELMKKVIEENA